MRYLLIIFSLFIVFSFNTTKPKEAKEDVVILDFPSYSDSIIYSGCEEILSQTPKSFYFSIYEDTIIDLNTIDSRISIKLKFNWLYNKYAEWPNNIGVTSIDVFKDNNIISNIDLTEITNVEAFPEKFTETGRYMEPVRDDICMKDVNMDSYLDFIFTANCGKRCWKSYFIYNPAKEIFEFNEPFDYTTPMYMDCHNKIVYSYIDADHYGSSYNAYKIEDADIRLIQKLRFHYKVKYVLKEYLDNTGALISRDTIIPKVGY